MRKDRILCLMMMSVLCFLIIGEPVKAAEKTNRQITIVEVPQNLNFYLDPYNEKGNGQIYSGKYVIQNAGKEAVTFTIEMSLSILDAESEIVFCPEEWNEEPVSRSIYMYVMFEGNQVEERHILTDLETPCKESVVLEPAGEEGDTAYISFGGMLSRSGDWKSGELAINSLYNMSSASMGYMSSVEGEHIRIENNGDKLDSGEKAELYLVPDEGYSLPSKVQVFMGDVETEIQYDAVTGKVLIENVENDVVIYANGITKAEVPDVEILSPEKMLWTWTAEKGVQAYEYSFLKEEETVKSGRIDVYDESVSWEWSEGLEDGEYFLCLKAIGDTVYCLNSEETHYQIMVDREMLQPSEEEQKPSSDMAEPKQPIEEDKTQEPEQPSEGDGTQEPEQPSEGDGTQEPEQPPEGDGTQEPEQPSEEGEKQESEQPPEGDGTQESEQPLEEGGKQESEQPLTDNIGGKEAEPANEENEKQKLIQSSDEDVKPESES